MRTRPRYEARPVPFETDFERICEVVCGARCVTLAPASSCIPSLAKATERISPRAPGSISRTAGYFIVTFEPRLPSTHSIVASRYAAARFRSEERRVGKGWSIRLWQLQDMEK